MAGDFVLVHGDLVANIKLDDILTKHRARREANRDACMTMVLRTLGEEPHRAKEARLATPVFALDPSGRCLQYEEFYPWSKNILLDPSLFEHDDIELRTDVIDCGIDICTPEVLALWSESFDYEQPRRNFLHGVLKDFELNGKLIYTEILETGYAARAHSLKMYDCISKDVMGRWTYPFVPDSNLGRGQSFRRTKEGTCLERGVQISKEATITKSVIGEGSEVGDWAKVSRSVIGRRCKIGQNVSIDGCYIWDDAIIGDESSVVRSILADSVVVGKGCQIPEGTLLSFGVQIGDGQILQSAPAPRISLVMNGSAPFANDTSLVGQSGKGALYQEQRDEDEDEDGDENNPAHVENSLFYSLAELNLSSDSVSTLHPDDSHDSDDGLSFSGSLHTGDPDGIPRNRLSSFASDESGMGTQGTDAFHGDAVHGLVDALRADDNEDFDSAKLEFMGLRLANNASDSSMRRAIAVAFARRAAELICPEHGGLEPTKAAEKAFTSKKGAIKFIREVGVGGEETELQAEFALALQKALSGVRGLEVARAGTLLAAMLQQLYNLDVLEEDGILAWWGDHRAGENESLERIKEKCRVLVQWLENADEEDDSDEDSD